MHLSNNELKALESAQNKRLAPLGICIIQNDNWLHAFLSLERYGLGEVIDIEYGIGKAFRLSTRARSSFKPAHIGALHSTGLRLALYHTYSQKKDVVTIQEGTWSQVFKDLEDMGFGEFTSIPNETSPQFHPNAIGLEWLKIQKLDEQDKRVLKYFTTEQGGAKEVKEDLHYGYPENLQAAFHLEAMGLGVQNHGNEELPYFVASREGYEEGKRL